MKIVETSTGKNYPVDILLVVFYTKTNLKNSTFGFLPTLRPTTNKTKRAVSCHRSDKEHY
jgi:hypothetical protein